MPRRSRSATTGPAGAHTATVSWGRTRGGSSVDWLTDWLIQFVSDVNNPAALAVLGGSAMVEYLFPPFPGDTITLFGAVLITAYGWSFAAVFTTVMLGSMAGAMADFYLGHHLRRRRSRKPGAGRRSAIIDRLVGKFHRHGALYLVINRFVPGIRALFFVAAGMAGMEPGKVLIYATISAALWNLGIIALGGLLGANLDTMREIVGDYYLVAWCILGVIVAALIARKLWSRRSGEGGG